MPASEKLKLEIGDTVTVMLNYDKPLKSEKYGNYTYSFQIDNKLYSYSCSEKMKERIDKLGFKAFDFLVLHKKAIGGGKSFIEVMKKTDFDSRAFKSPVDPIDRRFYEIIKEEAKTPVNANKEEWEVRERVISASWAITNSVKLWIRGSEMTRTGFDPKEFEEDVLRRARILLKIRDKLVKEPNDQEGTDSPPFSNQPL